MTSKFIPSQNRYFDPYHQRINSGTSGTSGLSQINTAYPQKYLSRVSNQQLLKAIGDNMVLNGLELSTSFVGPTAYIILSPGVLINDYTVIELPAASNLDFNVISYGDTPSTSSHLCVFSNFQYLETPDLDAQTSLVLTAYHVSSAGVISGTPTFNTTRNKLLLAIIDFTKTGSNISSLSKSSLSNISILGTTYYLKGTNNNAMSDFFEEVLGPPGTSGTSGRDATSGTGVASGTSGSSGMSNFGTAGSSGTSTTIGSSGTSGGIFQGNSGTSGTSGISGSSGTSDVVSTGTSGTVGTSGTSSTVGSGTSGTSGISGSSGTSGLTYDDLVTNDIIKSIFLINSL